MHEDESAVLAVNAAFYAALEEMDMTGMTAVWAGRSTDVCVHPGWEALHGWPSVREAWRAIFANTGYMRFDATELEVEILGDVARVSCVETLFSVVDSMTMHGRVAATNLYLRTEDGWRMVLHHGSPIASGQTIRRVGADDDN